jgi:UDP-3-O-[3-hydroxymyristoyl] N-acetylglucosamine deacetylase
MQLQKTVKREVSISGIGLFTGEKVSLKLVPLPANSGIIFYRTDLPDSPAIPAHLSFVRDTLRSTRLATEKASLGLVEHLLSALSAYEIDNVRIEVVGPEVPVCDGSAKQFVELIEKAGTAILDEPKDYLTVDRPIYWSEKEIHLIALPCDEFRISYTLYYPQSTFLRSQYFSLPIHRDTYKSDIASSRTFSLYEEIAPLIAQGFIKGGGLENALVIKGDTILNPEGARYGDEMVRHKILDLIGDLALLGRPLKAHVIAVRSGHASNIAFAKVLLDSFTRNQVEA